MGDFTRDDYSDVTEHDPDASHDDRSDRSGVTHRGRTEYDPAPDRRGRWLSAVVGLLGLWLVGSTVVATDPSAAAFWNGVLVGTGLVLTGGYNGYRRSKRELGSASVAATTVILGAWLLASPFLVGPPGDGAASVFVLNDVAIGLLAISVGVYDAVVIRLRRKKADPRPTATFDRTGQ